MSVFYKYSENKTMPETVHFDLFCWFHICYHVCFYLRLPLFFGCSKVSQKKVSQTNQNCFFQEQLKVCQRCECKHLWLFFVSSKESALTNTEKKSFHIKTFATARCKAVIIPMHYFVRYFDNSLKAKRRLLKESVEKLPKKRGECYMVSHT